MARKGEDPEMNPQTKAGKHAEPADKKANDARGDAIEKNLGEKGKDDK